jgi:hypothetical protein
LRRGDSDLIDNVGRYTEGQLSLFHVKIAANRMVTNEFWGTPNSKCPWSQWKIDALLNRKAISTGWKAKTLPPFRLTWDLILCIALLAHILDSFRIFFTSATLEQRIADVTDRDDITAIAKKVDTEFCYAPCCQASLTAKREAPLEKIKLFNWDALILRILKHV